MNKFVQKTVSLILIVLITLLILDNFKIIVFTKIIQECLSFSTLTLIIFSATSVVCTSKSGLTKFINYVILLTTISGILVTIIYNKQNLIVGVALLFTVVYALMDILNKS